jgi:hypothetical protein
MLTNAVRLALSIVPTKHHTHITAHATRCSRTHSRSAARSKATPTSARSFTPASAMDAV